MSTLFAPSAPAQRPGWLYRLRHPREGWQLWREEVRETRQALSKSEHRLLNGEKVKGRFVQMTYWGIALGFLVACIPAGFYFGFFEVYWHMPFAWFGVHGGGSLKPWWDGLFGGSPTWALYRHATFRDIPEPVFAFLAVGTFLAKPPKEGFKPAGTRQILIAPLVVVLMVFALGALSVWLVNFAGPVAWHAWVSAQGHPDWKLEHSAWLGRWSVGVLLPGYLIKRAVQAYWAPVGATLQGFLVDAAVDRKQSIANACGVSPETAVEFDSTGWHIIPFFIRLPLVPPVIRERFAHMWRENDAVSVRNLHGRVIAVILFWALVLLAIGFIGHYLIGSLHLYVPYFSHPAP